MSCCPLVESSTLYFIHLLMNIYIFILLISKIVTVYYDFTNGFLLQWKSFFFNESLAANDSDLLKWRFGVFFQATVDSIIKSLILLCVTSQ